MEQTLTIRIPQNWMTGVPDESLTLQHIFRLGISQYKLERAIHLYQHGVGSVGYIAEQLDLPKQDVIREFRQRGIEPEFSEQTLQEELGI